MSRWLPPAASAHAAAIDGMLEHVHLVMLALFAGWAAYFLYVLVRFRHGAQPRASHAGARGMFALVVVGAVVLAEAVLLVGSAIPLWNERAAARPDGGAPVVIRVVAEQFMWNVHYPGADGEFGGSSLALVSTENPVGLDRSSPFGRDDLVLLNEIHVPVNRPVVMQLSSKDVIHSFGVPAMRVKQDVVPGLRSAVWFTPTVEGTYEVACSQLCGLGHYRMSARLHVVSEEEYRRFLAENQNK